MPDAAETVITRDDLYAPGLDERIDVDRSLEDMARASRSVIRTPILRSSVFQYPFAGLAGAIAGWLVNANLIMHTPVDTIPSLPTATLYLLTGGGIGLVIGLQFGVIHRNPLNVIRCSLFGLLAGLCVPIVTGGLAQGAIWLMVDLPAVLLRNDAGRPRLDAMRGFGFFLNAAAHGVAWSLVCLASALGPGLGLRSVSIKFNGWVGGALGGLFGGLSMAILERLIPAEGNLSDTVRDAILIGQVGLWVGAGFAFMEFVTREAWFVLAKGWLRGKRLLLHRDQLSLGSAVTADVYLTSDPAIEPSHALLTKEGVRWLLRDNNTVAGTFVNGHKIRQCLLNDDDVVTIGQTVLKFKQRKHLS